MNKFNFYGYLDNNIIANGFLIPIYSDGVKFFFHELSKDNKTITGFTECNLNSYSRDSIVILQNVIPVKEDKESYMVIKFNGSATSGTFSEILDLISTKIFQGEIKSKILIDNAKKVFGESFKHELLQDAIKLFSSLDVKRRVLNKYLSKCSSLQLIKVASGNDVKFENYFEKFVVDTNKRILRVPASVEIIMEGDHDVVFANKHRGILYNPNLKETGIKAITWNHIHEDMHQNVWRIKKAGERSYTSFCIYGTENVGIEVARLSSKINETFAEVK